MIYHNTPLTMSLKSQMQILQGRGARPDLPISNAARHQIGLKSEDLRKVSKHKHLPTHDYHVGQDVMFHADSATSKAGSNFSQASNTLTQAGSMGPQATSTNSQAGNTIPP